MSPLRVAQRPGSSSQNLAEAPQRKGEQRRANDKEGEELRPDDVDAGAAEQDRRPPDFAVGFEPSAVARPGLSASAKAYKRPAPKIPVAGADGRTM